MPQNDRGVYIAPTPTDIGRVEQQVRDFLEQQAQANIADVSSKQNIHVRPILPTEDLNSGADNGWDENADPYFEQSGLNAGSNEVYNIDSDGKAAKKIVAIVAVTNKSGDPISPQIEFQTATGGVFERLQIEGLETDPEDTLLLADPVVVGATQSVDIFQHAEAAGDDEVVYHGFVAEPAGNTLEDSDRFLSERQ